MLGSKGFVLDPHGLGIFINYIIYSKAEIKYGTKTVNICSKPPRNGSFAMGRRYLLNQLTHRNGFRAVESHAQSGV